MKILVVEAFLFARLFEKWLAETKYQIRVLAATTGEQALTMIAEEQPTLVMAASQLPDMTGLQLLKKIKEEKPEIKFCLLSKESGNEFWQEAISSGADFYLEIPTSKKAIIGELQSLLKQQAS